MQVFLSLLPLGVKLFGWFLDRSKADKRVKEQWLKTVDTVEKHMQLSVKLNESDRAQIEDLKKRWESERKK